MIRFFGPVLLACLCGSLAAESLDSLFDNVNSDTIVKNSGDRVDALDRPVFLYFGKVETQGIFASGFNESHTRYPVSSLYYFLHFQGGVDVQPIPQARLIGTFSTYLPQKLDPTLIDNIRNGTTQEGTGTTTTTVVNTEQVLALDELFLDYTIADSAFFRVGKFGLTWGYGHLFNPGNLVTDTSDGINLKTFAAAGPFNLTGVVIANPKFFQDVTHPRADEMGYAGNLGFSAGQFTGQFSAYRQRDKGAQLDAGVRTSLFGLDLYTEVLGYQNPASDRWWPGLLAGAFYQLRGSWPWKLLAEYWLDGSAFAVNRSVGLGAVSGAIDRSIDLKFSAKWYHSLDDGSGQLVTGIDFSPTPKLNIAFGVPWTYGPADGKYMLGNTDLEKRNLTVLLSVGVKFDFEKAR